MKIAVSYINSKYDLETTFKLINSSAADYIHVDLMDGIYVPTNNFETRLGSLWLRAQKPLDIHLMVNNPIQYLNLFKDLKVEAITVHPQVVPDIKKLKRELALQNIKLGIAINPDEEVTKYVNLLPLVDQVLIMSVTPGLGGQTFKKEVIGKIRELKKLKPDVIIGIDGGINPDTIKLLPPLDYVVSGSYICQSNDFNTAIAMLKGSKINEK